MTEAKGVAAKDTKAATTTEKKIPAKEMAENLCKATIADFET
jgi:hypothetical protein